MKKLISLIIVIVLLFAVYTADPVRVSGGAQEGPAVGMQIESFNSADLTGEKVSSELFSEAELTVINYWATWCPPCIREMPEFSKLHKHFFSEGEEGKVQLIGVICEGNGCTPQSAKAYLDENGFEWRNIRSTAELDKVFYTSNSIPQTLIVNREGKVLSHRIGAFASYEQLFEYVSSFLDSAQSPSSAPAVETAKPKAGSCGGF